MATLESVHQANPIKRDMELLRADEDLCIWRIAGTSDRLIVSMSTVGLDENRPPDPQFMSLAKGNTDTMLFFSDPRRNWLNRTGMIEEITAVIDAERTRTKATHVSALGNSMGGYSAFVLPAFTKIDVAIAFSPQFSINPYVAPDEARWPEFRARIPTLRISNVADYLNGTTQYYLFFGRHPSEAAQRKLVPDRPNLKYYLMPNTGHNTVNRMKDAKVLAPILQACLHGRNGELRRIMTETFDARLVRPKPPSEGTT